MILYINCWFVAARYIFVFYNAKNCQNVEKWQVVISSIFQVVSTDGSVAKSKETGINAAKLVKIKRKKVYSNATDEAADKHEKKTAEKRPF